METPAFDSEFCTVQYVPEKNFVLLRWKKACSFDNYRNPHMIVLDLLAKHPDSNYMVDARNGFEDEKEDVEWGFSYMIPTMAKTDCKKVVFIMHEKNDIEGEMDMWSNEFRKYFEVYRTASEEEALRCIR